MKLAELMTTLKTLFPMEEKNPVLICESGIFLHLDGITSKTDNEFCVYVQVIAASRSLTGEGNAVCAEIENIVDKVINYDGLKKYKCSFTGIKPVNTTTPLFIYAACFSFSLYKDLQEKPLI